jgi:hypothetical protein
MSSRIVMVSVTAATPLGNEDDDDAARHIDPTQK